MTHLSCDEVLFSPLPTLASESLLHFERTDIVGQTAMSTIHRARSLNKPKLNCGHEQQTEGRCEHTDKKPPQAAFR